MVRDGLLEITNEQAFADRTATYALLTEASRTGVQAQPRSRAQHRLHHGASGAAAAKFADHLAGTVRKFWVAIIPGWRCGRCTGWDCSRKCCRNSASIDSLVVRDFYHRYTVDEHSLRTIEHLQELGDPQDPRGKHFAPLWRTVDRRDLLISVVAAA